MNRERSDKIRQIYKRLLADAALDGRLIEVDGGQKVHVAETGSSSPLLLFPGTGNSALFMLPLLEHLEEVRAIGIDRPGWGLSDPDDLPRKRYREAVVAWMEELLRDLKRIEAHSLDLGSRGRLGAAGGSGGNRGRDTGCAADRVSQRGSRNRCGSTGTVCRGSGSFLEEQVGDGRG